MVDDLLEAGAEGDLVGQLAEPFPVTVIAELLGIPAERRVEFKRWSDALVGALGGGWDPASAQSSILEMFGYLAGVVADRAEHPADDLIGRLVASSEADDDGEPLSPVEITAFAILLLVAGNETTTNLIGNGYHALVHRPDVVRQLRADPTLVPAAIEETLRFDGPIQALFRGATEDVELAGVTIPKGATLMVAFAAANRDPDHFAHPDTFDLDRKGAHDHLGFGHGIHYCLGASLARLEARIVAETLLRRTRSVEPTAPGTRTDGLVLRGFTRLPVHARAARSSR
jgi:cytochrome P450